jgi:hypothetical protein
MKLARVLQVVIGSLCTLGILSTLPLVVSRWPIAGASTLILPIMLFVFAAATVGTMEVQIRSLRSKGARVRKEIDAIAARVFDRPAAVRPGYDLSVTMPAATASFVSTFDAGTGFTTAGEFRGVSVSVASHVSRVGRQLGEMSHVYSHVVVDVLGADTRFVLTRQGAAAVLGRVSGVTRDVKVGDDAFDAMWNVDADEGLARAVLDPSIRARLMELKSRVSLVSQEWGPGGMSVILTSHGLAIRWPGEFNVEFAVAIRDLLIDMRTRMLAHLDRVARGAQGAEVGYRVYAEQEAPPSEDGAQEGEPARAKG